MSTLQGVLTFHSETGTEGGYWAFQDERYTGLRTPESDNAARCTRCGRVRDMREDEPGASFTYWEGDHYRASDKPEADQEDGPDGSFIQAQNARAAACYEGGHERWELLYPKGTWSYEGLHILKSGDHLRVHYPQGHEKAGQVAWEGTIALTQLDLFTCHAYGMWIHADQQGIAREEWARMFLAEWPGELTPA